MNERNKKELKITGYSDDIISFDGSIYDEFSPDYATATAILKLPDGTQIKVYYGDDGIWRIEPQTAIEIPHTLTKGDKGKDENDVLIIHAPIDYVTYTTGIEIGFCGEVELPASQNVTYLLLTKVLRDCEYDKQLVKAVLAGTFNNT